MKRDKHALAVRRMLAELSGSGVQVAEADMFMLHAFASRSVYATDMLAHACQFASFEEYNDWQRRQTARSSNGRHPDKTLACVLEEIKNCIRRKNAGSTLP